MTKTAAPPKAKKATPAKTPPPPPFLSQILGRVPERVARMELTTPCGLRAADMGLQARLRTKTRALQFRATLSITAKTGAATAFAGVWATTEDEAIRSLIADLEQSNLPRVGGAVEEQTRRGGLREMPHYAVIVPYSPEPVAQAA